MSPFFISSIETQSIVLQLAILSGSLKENISEVSRVRSLLLGYVSPA